MKGGDSDADGLLVSSTNKNGKTTTEFVSPTIYYTTDDYYYIDSENVTAGDILVNLIRMKLTGLAQTLQP